MISIYNNVFQSESTNTIKLAEYYEKISNGFWQDEILQYRINKSPDLKKRLPAITASGYFPNERKNDKCKKHSGVLVLDYDQKENPNILEKRDEIYADEYVEAGHISAGGQGLAIFVKIDKRKHIESFTALEKYFANKYQIISDPSCKNVARLRFVSYDPDIYVNPNSKKWTEITERKKVMPYNYQPIYTANDIDYVINQINQTATDLTSDYHNWLSIGFSIASEFGESGRSYFHAVSRYHTDYSATKTDKKYDNILNTGSNKFTIATFFWIAKVNGLKIKSLQTEKIQRVATVRKKTIGKPGGAVSIQEATTESIKYLTELEQYDKKEVEEITKKVMDSNIEENNETADIDLIIEYIQGLGLKYNEITQRVEHSDGDITDRYENSVYLNCKMIFPKTKMSKDLISNIINSDRIETYNPFLLFFSKNAHVKSKGRIDEVLGCFSTFTRNHENTVFLGGLIKKWMCSLIGSIHGTYSLLTLVLIGKQGTNKTNFFRTFLPDELQRYYAESKLDRDKDDEILMTQKLILVDDEFGGKSKKEAGKFKELSSKQIITARKSYGKYNEDFTRLAVLGGTSNENDIINDPTGNRRIIPVLLSNFDYISYSKINKTELFMELFQYWGKNGNDWFLTLNEIDRLNEFSQEFTEICIEEDMIRQCFELPTTKQKGEFMTATEMINYCEARLTKQRLYHKQFGKILKKLGFEKVQKYKRGFGYNVVKIDKDNPFN